MLQLYYGRENLDKDRFMFHQIKESLERSQRVILMVPDQFTLQAERNAFAYLNVDGLMDLEILSQTRLGTRVLAETGGSSRVHIDKYGRHMLLAKIIAEEDETLEAFRGMKRASSFIELVNDMIIELKQFNVSPEELPNLISQTDPNSLLHRKLKDVMRIYSRYEERISGKYMDTEDYMSLFVNAVKQSEMIQKSEIWISGFDTFTPKSELLMEELMRCAQKVNVVLTADGRCLKQGQAGESAAGQRERKLPDHDLFDLAVRVIKRLSLIAVQNGIEWAEAEVDSAYEFSEKEKAAELRYLEQMLYAFPYRSYKLGNDYEESNDLAMHFCRSANFYSEAETIASSICDLIRERGMRYREIAVICNDMEGRGSVLRRVFEEYGIPAFIDQKRKITHHPAVEFLSALLDVVTLGWRYEDVFRLLKTGLTDLKTGQREALENYAIKYRIRGTRWKKAFQLGVNDEGEEKLEVLNQLRKKVQDTLQPFEKAFHREKTSRGKTTVLYEFLSDRIQMPERLEALADQLTEWREYEAAEESAQVWNVIIHLLDQMVDLLDDEELSDEEFCEMLKSGLETVEIGLIPPTMDQVIVGTMQRTRTGAIRALFVAGANDGLLPMTGGSEELLSEDEKEILRESKIEICKDEELRVAEERLAIYRNLSKPSEYLWMGCAAADLEGKELRSSMLYDKMRKMFPNSQEEKDVVNQALDRGSDERIIERPVETLSHLTEAIRACRDGAELSDWWRESYNWLKRTGMEAGKMRTMKAGLLFENRQERLERKLTEKIYKKEGLEVFTMSPSRLERFSRCPFSHFVQYGLWPEELRVFEVAGREAGDVYHECLMRLSDQLTVPGMELNAEASPWMQLNQVECSERVSSLMQQISQEYREGMLSQGEEERYRAERMKEVCSSAAWALVSHVQRGRIREVFFEAPFGSGRETEFPSIHVEAGGQSVLIEGKIDRVDILGSGFSDDQRASGQEPSYVKIIDYKSGKERFDLQEARGGWRLQLMVYLQAAIRGMEQKQKGAEVKPAGVFYFEIAEPMIDASGMDSLAEETERYREQIAAEIQRGFRLDGILLDHADVVSGIAGDLTEEGSGFSQIAPVKRTKDGIYAGTSDQRLLSEEQFSQLQGAVMQTVEQLCESFVGGKIDAAPKKTKYDNACKFCQYRSICYFDMAFDGCCYDRV